MHKELKKLAIDLAKGKPVGDFSVSQMEETFRESLAELILDEDGKINYSKWNHNKNLVFEIMSTMIDEVLPKTVADAFKQFAEVKNFGHGQKPRFHVKSGKANVKRFVTKVAAAGAYERVRLDKGFVDVDTYAHGGAVYQTLEGFLAGRESISEVLQLMLEGLEDSLYADVATALKGSINEMPDANVHEGAGWSKSGVDKVIATVRAYGSPIMICPPEYAATITPTSGFEADADKNDMREQGYIGKYKGVPVVVLNQSFTDATNSTKAIDPTTAYVVPGGSFEKPVKVALEGNTLIRDVENHDWSVEMQLYRKLGVSVLNVNHIGAITDASLS